MGQAGRQHSSPGSPIQLARNRKRWTAAQREQSRKFWERKNAKIAAREARRQEREARQREVVRERDRRAGLVQAAAGAALEAGQPPLGVGDPRRTARNSYVFGQYGAAARERTAASTDGYIHESEHDIGFEPLNRGSGLSRVRNTSLEKRGSAYLEAKPMHQSHVGTGTGKSMLDRDQSGLTTQHYRDTQRALLQTNDPGAVSAAKQLNQLAYAHDVAGFQRPPRNLRADMRLADRSHKMMSGNVKSVTYAHSPGRESTVWLGARERAEIELSRFAARTGRWPTVKHQNRVLRRHQESEG